MFESPVFVFLNRCGLSTHLVVCVVSIVGGIDSVGTCVNVVSTLGPHSGVPHCWANYLSPLAMTGLHVCMCVCVCDLQWRTQVVALQHPALHLPATCVQHSSVIWTTRSRRTSCERYSARYMQDYAHLLLLIFREAFCVENMGKSGIWWLPEKFRNLIKIQGNVG